MRDIFSNPKDKIEVNPISDPVLYDVWFKAMVIGEYLTSVDEYPPDDDNKILTDWETKLILAWMQMRAEDWWEYCDFLEKLCEQDIAEAIAEHYKDISGEVAVFEWLDNLMDLWYIRVAIVAAIGTDSPVYKEYNEILYNIFGTAGNQREFIDQRYPGVYRDWSGMHKLKEDVKDTPWFWQPT